MAANPISEVVAKCPETRDAERDRLLLEQLPQVRFIARKIHARLPAHVELDDLVHAGVVGLMDAANRYDPSRNVQFKSYAQFRIRGAIFDDLRELDWGPRELRRKSRAIDEAHHKLSSALGRAASHQELAEELGMKLRPFQLMLGDLHALDVTSVHREDNGEGAEEDWNELKPDVEQDDPFHLCLEGETKTLLANAVAELPDRERRLLAMYYYEELTMREIGEKLGVVESRVSQLHAGALDRLRSRLQKSL